MGGVASFHDAFQQNCQDYRVGGQDFHNHLDPSRF